MAADPLEQLARDAAHCGIFCDFDGSLSPIVPDPQKARAVRGAGRALHALARRFGIVAVISGRPVSFLARRLHARGVRVVGLYGIEERVGRRLRVLPEVAAAHGAVDRAVRRLRDELTDHQGVWVEDKGLAVSVHFRRAPEPLEAMALAQPVVEDVAASEGLALLARGRLVLEIAPSVSVDKGEVVRRLIEEKALRGALVAGDDAGDIPMFEAVAGLAVVVRIGVVNEEAPPRLFELADRRVDGPRALVRIFRDLARRARG